MAHPSESAEAVDVPSSLSMEDAAEAFADIDNTAEPENEEITEDDDEPEDGEEQSEDEDADEDGEPETAIEAPASLNADEKKAFAAATPEVQQAWADAETRRNRQVQEATTKASQAQREAEARAAAADTEAKQNYAKQLEQFTEAFAPREPHPNWFPNESAYRAAKSEYDAERAQHDELVQRIQSIDTEAQTEARKAFVEQRDRELMAIPEIANAETRQGYLDKAMGAATRLGYDVGTLTQTMDASDVKRLHEVAQAFEDQAKYKAAMSRKMERVREGKSRSLKPGVAQPGGSGNRAAEKALANFRSNPSSMAAAAAVFGD